MQKVLYGLMVVLLTLGISTEDFGEESKLQITGGFGPKYGSFFGINTGYNFLNYHSNHLGFHAGGGYRWSVVTWATGIRYSFGNQDRFTTDANFGVSDIVVDYFDSSSQNEIVYNPSILIGYQRITNIGIIIESGIGLIYSGESDGSLGVPFDKYPFDLVVTFGIGYSFF